MDFWGVNPWNGLFWGVTLRGLEFFGSYPMKMGMKKMGMKKMSSTGKKMGMGKKSMKGNKKTTQVSDRYK